MKRVINGKAYNTDTSGWLAETTATMKDLERGKVAVKIELYETRSDPFGTGLFLMRTETWTKGKRTEKHEELTPLDSITHAREVLGPLMKRTWHGQGQPETFLKAAQRDMRTIDKEQSLKADAVLVRFPRTLKKELAARAKRDGMSLNSFILRCAERCLQAGDAA